MIISRRMRWAGHVEGMGKKRIACRDLVREYEGKRQFEDLDVCGRVILNWFEIGWHGVDWIGLAQDVEKWHAVVNAVMNLRVA
jgi:hypothetical protein